MCIRDRGIVVGVGQFEGIEERDMEGKYLCPGFIDSHLHLESTLVTPSELIGQAVQCGTTTYIVDPHESANVDVYKRQPWGKILLVEVERGQHLHTYVELWMPIC